MAKVKIQGHASGTGILTITAPNTSTDRTITLPDATGTLLNSDGEGTDYLAPDGDGSNLTGIQSPLVEGTDYLAPDGDGSNLTALDATTLTGNLPAIDGSNLTGVAPTKAVVEALGIDVPATNLTGTVPTASLGSGTADSSVHLRGDGAWASAAAGFNSVQVFTSSGTWTRPSGVTKVNIFVVGGGAGGGGAHTAYAGAGGGGGGTCIKYALDVSSISSATVTIGAAGSAGGAPGAGGAGGASWWSGGGIAYTGNGGSGGGSSHGTAYGGSGGTAANGTLNVTGQAGNSNSYISHGGSPLLFGIGAVKQYSSNNHTNYGTGYGAGGHGGIHNASHAAGTAGQSGIVVVEEYK